MKRTTSLEQKVASFGTCVGIFLAAVIIAYAAVTWFMNKDYIIIFDPKTVGNFDITDTIDNDIPTQIGLEDEVGISPIVTNKGTKLQMCMHTGLRLR